MIVNALVHESAGAAPHEACGLLFGSVDRVTAWSATPNVAADPHRHFEIDPAALIAAYRAERAGGPAIIGWWHSHPGGDPSPSLTDAAMAVPDGRLWLIVGAGGVAAWRASNGGTVHGRFDPVTIEMA
ncbi:M67 family metallopeptidase [Sphingomonas sp. FW199]|uniref:M67 family metallopeptidase n=1 Tax=Sphingomonas sp. FW199 TaxID=3400217 RepID=UPI003CE9CE40